MLSLYAHASDAQFTSLMWFDESDWLLGVDKISVGYRYRSLEKQELSEMNELRASLSTIWSQNICEVDIFLANLNNLKQPVLFLVARRGILLSLVETEKDRYNHNNLAVVQY